MLGKCLTLSLGILTATCCAATAAPPGDTASATHAAEGATAGLSVDPRDPALLESTVTAEEAVDAAELVTGGHAVGFVIGRDQGVLRYAVQTVANGRALAVYVDTVIGNANRVVDQGPVDAVFHGPALAAVKDVGAGGGTDLVAAMDLAQRDHSGKVIQVMPTLRNGRAAFQMTLFDHGTLSTTQTAAGSGRLLAGG